MEALRDDPGHDTLIIAKKENPQGYKNAGEIPAIN